MASVFDTAKYILYKKGRMSTWKLQKLCYYSQAWALAWTETPLFEEDFEAWANGPVCPELFNAHRGMDMISERELKKGDRNNLNDGEKGSIDIVLETYGDMEPYDLRERTHHEAPWLNARNGLPEGAKSNNIISKDAMGEYYAGL